jgi:accessory gene regulator protein AgrB
VPLRKLIVRQVLVGAVIGAIIALSRGITTGIAYGILFVVISTPIAYWVEQRRARLRDEQDDAPD